MINLITPITVTLITALLGACAEGNFSGGSMSKSKSNCASGGKNCSNGKTPSGDLIATDGSGLCLKKAPAIDFILVMDVSNSMKPQSERVNAAFSGLATNLSNININGLGKVPAVRFGLIAYEDVIQFEAPLSSNIEDVKRKIIDKFQAVFPGGDSSEAGLMAAAKGLGLARGKSDSIKVMFLVTDAFSHDGTPLGAGEGIRNYNPKAVSDILAEPEMKLTFIYTATPKTGGLKSPNPTPPFPNAVDQWTDIRSTAASAVGRPQLGQDFEVSTFTTNEVSDAIPQDIATQLRKCL